MGRLLDMVKTVYRRRREYAVAQVDVFSGSAFLWAEAVCAVLRRLGKPCILTLRGGNLPEFARRHPVRVRRLLRGAQAVTAPSRYLYERMAPYRPDLRLLPNALDLRAYPFRLRRNPAPGLVWLRAFHEIYNPSLGPKVLARLLPEFPDARLTMVGPDKGDGSLERARQTARDLGIAERVCFPGGVAKTEVPDWLQKGDIFLNTTNVDNTPVSVLEAMACGLCVVSTNVGGLPYLLNHEQDALLVPPDDAAAMASAVRRVLAEPGLSERLSANGRAKAGQHDWSVVLPQWEALFLSLAKPTGHEGGR
jgi:glycosyltransferase involved in cell wall biosynthesis